MNEVSPKNILRDHLAQIAIEKVEQCEFSAIDRLPAVPVNRFDAQPPMQRHALAAPESARGITVSYSS